MSTVTVSSKNQVTLPAGIVKELGIKGGDKLVMELIRGRIIMQPQPDSWADYYIGRVKGVYSSTREEADNYITQLRASPERDEWFQQFEGLCVKNADVKLVVEALREQPDYAASEVELDRTISGKDGRPMGGGRMQKALDLLVEPNKWVRRIVILDANGQQSNVKYRLVHELARPVTAAR